MRAGLVVVIVLLALAALAAAYYMATPSGDGGGAVRVDLIGAGGASTVYAEVADTAEEQRLGLMGREDLGGDRGMLFVFDDDRARSFWMKDTPIPLDMVFVASDYTIVDLNSNATPFSEAIFTSRAPCRYVVEVNGGYCAAHGIGIGDRIRIY